MTDKMSDKNVLITGGTSGIGKAIAEAILKDGGNVFVFSRDKRKLQKTMMDLSGLSGNIFGSTGDVSSQDSNKKIFDEFDKVYGKIDVLINNAGLPARSIVEASYEEIDYAMAVNLTGYMYCAKEAISRMRKYDGGHIVNICSMSSKTRDADTDLYTATKAGVDGFSESLRKKINEYNIKVSDIEPGSVNTGMVVMSNGRKMELEEAEKLLDPKDIAEAVLFCLTRPKRTDVVQIQIRPHKQFI